MSDHEEKNANRIIGRVLRGNDALNRCNIKDAKILIEVSHDEFIDFVESMNLMLATPGPSIMKAGELSYLGAIVRAKGT